MAKATEPNWPIELSLPCRVEVEEDTQIMVEGRGNSGGRYGIDIKPILSAFTFKMVNC